MSYFRFNCAQRTIDTKMTGVLFLAFFLVLFVLSFCLFVFVVVVVVFVVVVVVYTLIFLSTDPENLPK